MLQAIDAHEGLAVVKFWAPWCRICAHTDPEIKAAVASMNEDPGGKFGDVKFFSVEFNDGNKVTFTYLVLATVGALPCTELFGPIHGKAAPMCVHGYAVQYSTNSSSD